MQTVCDIGKEKLYIEARAAPTQEIDAKIDACAGCKISLICYQCQSYDLVRRLN